MKKVYYNLETLEIKGYSEGEEITMSFPFIETDQNLNLLWNFKIENGEVKTIRMHFTDEEWEIIIKEGKL